jgi:DNA primase large subunit
LIFCQRQLPEWLFKGLMQNLQQQLNNPHATRFLAVRYAHDVLGMTMDESYEWAAGNVSDPTATGRPDTMMKSYQKIRPQVAEGDRIRLRPPRRRGR